MKNIIKSAKDQGLNYQALAISECEIDLKLIIKNSILNDDSFSVIKARVTERISECVNSLENNTLKEKTKKIMSTFADVVYFQTLMAIGSHEKLFLLTQLSHLSVRQKDAVIKRAKETENFMRFSKPSYNMGAANAKYHKEYMDDVRQRLINVADLRAKEDRTSKLSLRNLAEMQVRQDYHEKQLDDFKYSGVNLIWIRPHANCSKRCEPYQGRLYSLDGTSGTIDGISYVPLTEATDNPNDYYTTKAGKTYKNGCISGFNCRHELVAYSKGNKPTEIPAKVINRQRFIEGKQREMERKIFRLKCRALENENVLNDTAIIYRKRAKEEYEKYKAFSRENNVAFYPSRVENFKENK